jgi:hypothetical protein
MSTPTTFMGLPNPTVGADSNTWGGFLNTCISGFDTLAVAAVPVTVSTTGSLAVYNGSALIKADASSGAIVLTLPDATVASNKGRRYSIVKIDATGNTVTLQGFGGQTISGAASVILSTQWFIVAVVSDGANWVNSDFDSTVATPVSVANGGTGDTTLALNGVLYGNGTSPVQVTAAGGANSVLTANSGAPVFSSTPTVTSITTTGGTTTLAGTISITGTASYTTANPTFFSQTGSGAVVLATSPTLVTPNLGVASASSVSTTAGVSVGTTITSYNGIATVSNGIAPTIAKVDAVTQSAAISGAALYTVPASGAGQYEISWSAVVTQAATTSSTLGGLNTGFQVTYTDNDTSASSTTPLAAAPAAATNTAYSQTNANNTVGTQASGTVVVNAKASSSITYSFGYASSGGTVMQYAIHVKVRFLGL